MPKNNKSSTAKKHQKETDKILNPNGQDKLNFIEIKYERFKEWISKTTDSKPMRYLYAGIVGFLAAGSFVGICVLTGGVPLGILILSAAGVGILSAVGANKKMNNIIRTKKIEAVARANAETLDDHDESIEEHGTAIHHLDSKVNHHDAELADMKQLAGIFARHTHIPSEAKEDKEVLEKFLQKHLNQITHTNHSKVSEFQADIPPEVMAELLGEEKTQATSTQKHSEKEEETPFIVKPTTQTTAAFFAPKTTLNITTNTTTETDEDDVNASLISAP